MGVTTWAAETLVEISKSPSRCGEGHGAELFMIPDARSVSRRQMWHGSLPVDFLLIYTKSMG